MVSLRDNSENTQKICLLSKEGKIVFHTRNPRIWRDSARGIVK